MSCDIEVTNESVRGRENFQLYNDAGYGYADVSQCEMSRFLRKVLFFLVKNYLQIKVTKNKN